MKAIGSPTQAAPFKIYADRIIEIGTNTINVLQMASTLRLRRSCEALYFVCPSSWPHSTDPNLHPRLVVLVNPHTLAAKQPRMRSEPIDDDRGGRILQSFDIV
jgi:hypothetical protein